MRMHAWHECHVRLHAAHNLSHIDLSCWASEAQAALHSTRCADVALEGESMGHLDKVILGNPIAIGDLGDRGQPIPMKGEVHQEPKRKIGVSGQAQVIGLH